MSFETSLIDLCCSHFVILLDETSEVYFTLEGDVKLKHLDVFFLGKMSRWFLETNFDVTILGHIPIDATGGVYFILEDKIFCKQTSRRSYQERDQSGIECLFVKEKKKRNQLLSIEFASPVYFFSSDYIIDIHVFLYRDIIGDGWKRSKGISFRKKQNSLRHSHNTNDEENGVSSDDIAADERVNEFSGNWRMEFSYW